MDSNNPFKLTDIDSMMSLVSSIFSELNIGLLIYHLDDPSDPRTLRLIYVNRSASEYTGTDLNAKLGLFILEAFPALAGTGVPETYAEVALTNRSQNLGAFEYEGDEHVGRGYYSVKAFPMPNRCVGIAFENITVRKQLEEMVIKLRNK